ncbi:lambda phage terminase A [Edaphobacter acidisoli]|uniref:Lambda phage terminase A n=1 Tax=Edaphobacter acidisoli TaxID=2040573 RepID=A0A916WAA1_9BACT|nr:terminase TerL endonuclease subunit [Edaphobacter acidisoli]GGA80782.1 lambda phage terminase A [Edaphobacter acidisoli]
MAKKLSVAEKYIRDVLAGKIVTSRLVRLQIERHVKDLKEGDKRGLVFDRDAAQHVIDFFPTFLEHVEGTLDGQTFVLEPFQQAKLWILYGWRWKDTGFRRFKFAYNEIGRGNCKSTEASGLCLYELLGIGEPGAHIYSAATDKDTARIVFDTAQLMLKRSPFLRERVTCYLDNMHIPGTAAKFEPVASGAELLLGLRPSFIVFDELHESPNAKLWEVFESAMGKRDSPLLYACTNSGYDRHSICWRKREYSVKVLEGVFQDDTWFAWICGLDEGDDWEDERNWIKANPGLGVMVKLKELREAAAKAKNDPASLNSFLRFRMSVWTTSDVAWMPPHIWDPCAARVVDRMALRGRSCFGALDLSTTTDISSFVMVFPPVPDDDFWYVVPEFFLPEESIQDRVKRDRVPYDVWARQGLFNLTKNGRIIDYRAIREKIHEMAELYSIKEIMFDRWNASDLVRNLEEDGFTMVKWGQGFNDMHAPVKRLMELTLEGKWAHGGNPVLRWMALNVVIYMDPAGNMKMDKSRSKEKIDGMVASAMALGRAMQVPDAQYTRPYVVYV